MKLKDKIMIGKVRVEIDESYSNGYKEGAADCLKCIYALLVAGDKGMFPALGLLTAREKVALNTAMQKIRDHVHSPTADSNESE
jgi:hypothetical protein